MEKKPKDIIFGERVRHKIMEGVSTVHKAVSVTLGSRGRNVSLEKNWGAPIIVHDGVTVAREVVLADSFENQAAQSVIEAAQNTNDEAGDGTTTATILTYAIFKEGVKAVSAGMNPMVIRKGIERAVDIAIETLQTMSAKVEEFDTIKSVAIISSASEELGEKIATAVQKVGEYGVVTVGEAGGYETEVEYKEGMEFDRGIMSPLVVTNRERMEVEVEGEKTLSSDERPYIAIFNKKVKNQDVLPVLSKIRSYDNKAEILIIADDFEEETVALLVVNKYRGNQPIWGVKSPEYGVHRSNVLNDIAIMTGGKVIGGETGLKPEQFVCDMESDENMAGRCDKFLITKDTTVIIGGGGEKEAVDDQIAFLKKEIENARNDAEKDKLQGRLSRLSSGVAVIQVGAPSEAEMREVKERVYDAVNATQAAIEMGVVPGGGVAMVRAATAIEKEIEKLKGDELETGMDIVKLSLLYPMRKLVANSGNENPDYVVGKIAESSDFNLGYNVNSESYENMFESGIIDPVKVSITALRNAASVATMLLTTECMISFQRKKENAQIDDIGIGFFQDD